MTKQEKTAFLKQPAYQCRICISFGAVVLKNVYLGKCPLHHLPLKLKGTVKDVYNRY